MRTLILSDIHLGSRHCNVDLLGDLLDREPFDRLILNGDTLHSVNLRKLSGAHWGLLDQVRKLRRSRELLLIRGNHDHEDDHVPLFHADGNSSHNHTLPSFALQLTTKVNKKLAKWLKKKSKHWSGLLEFVRGKSIAHAGAQGMHGIITGHTHFAEDSKTNNVHYLNAGCWTEYPCSYVVVDRETIVLKHAGE